MSEKIYDLAVIGGGPCGISTVVEAKHQGIENVVLLEKGDNHSQTIRNFYKDNKRVDKAYKGMDSETKGSIEFHDGTKESTLDYFDTLLDNDKIDTFFKSEVEGIKKNGDLFEITTAKEVYKAKNVVIAIGKMGKPNKPDYKIPPSLTPIVNFNLDKCSKGESILVVGGGNSAAEYATELNKVNEVTLSYRKPTFTRLNEINFKAIVDAHKYQNMRLKVSSNIVKIENEQGKALVDFGDDFPIVFDRVIYAIGGSTPVDFLKKCSVELNESNQPIVDENCQTPTKGLFVGGDIITKSGGSIVVSINHAHKIITTILEQK